MVKGTTRRVVVLRGTGGGAFEQAIFFIREDAGANFSRESVIAEAQRIAEDFVQGKRRGRTWRKPLLYTSAGATAVGIAWALCALL